MGEDVRIYRSFTEALSEIRRDVKEMGHRIHTQTYQDKVIADDPDYETLEVTNYMYKVTNCDLDQLNPTQPWADNEFEERIGGGFENPGEAWKHRPEVWTEFLTDEGTFHYTYSERIGNFPDEIVRTLENDSLSRQAFMSIWEPSDICSSGGAERIPCSLGYMFQCRRGALDVTYLQRSADLATHFVNDVWMANRMRDYIAKRLDMIPGHFCHWIGSLHVFKKDVRGVF